MNADNRFAPVDPNEDFETWLERQPWTEQGKREAKHHYSEAYRLDLNPPTVDQWRRMAIANCWISPGGTEAVRP